MSIIYELLYELMNHAQTQLFLWISRRCNKKAKLEQKSSVIGKL